MRDSSNEDHPREEYIERREDHCSTPHTPHTLHTQRDKRIPINIRLRRDVHNVFMKYCAITGMTAGDFYEKAGVLYMDVNPAPDGVVLFVSRPEGRSDLKDRMVIQICVQELQELVDGFGRYHAQGLPFPRSLMERLCRVFDKCYKVSNPSDELNRLVEEALNYVE